MNGTVCGTNVYVIDADWTYNRKAVTCKKCLQMIQGKSDEYLVIDMRKRRIRRR